MASNSTNLTHSLPEGLDCIVVMPAYNEQGCIEKVLQDWIKTLRGLLANRFAIVVVNDGSRDRTGELLDGLIATDSELRVVHQVNAGHGAALMAAYRLAVAAKPLYVFHVDSDDQFVPADFEKLWKRRTESDFILGWRQARHDAPHRIVISHILRNINGVLFGHRIPDANIPFRLIKADYLQRLLPRVPPGMFAPNIALAVMAAWDDKPLMNIPVEHRDRQTGTVSIVSWRLIRACLISLGQLLRLRGQLMRSAGVRA